MPVKKKRRNAQYSEEYWKARFSDSDPEAVKRAIKRVYSVYPKDKMPQGLSDPMYIMNSIALELGIGDGRGNFNLPTKRNGSMSSRKYAYGTKRDYPKIDLYVDGEYKATTTWARTPKEAKEKYALSEEVSLSRISAQRQNPCGRKKGQRGKSPRRNSASKYYNEKEREGHEKALKRWRAGELDKYRTHGQPDWARRNMIRALKIHPHLNSVEDWQRLHEAKLIGRKRQSLKRSIQKGAYFPAARRNSKGGYAKGLWYILYAPNGYNYQVYQKKTRDGWQFGHWLYSDDAKAYRGYGAAKRVFNEMNRRMKMPGGASLAIAIESEAKSLMGT